MTDPDVPGGSPTEERVAAHPELSRRALLGAAAAGTAGLVIGGLTGPLLIASPAAAPTEPAVPEPTVHPFFGAHQAGITTPVQDHLFFAAFDMVDGTDRRDLERLLRDWTAGAARLTEGLQVGASGALAGDAELPPDDTGEALDLTPSALTVTIGFGPGLFERNGVDRYGLAAARPPELERLPPFKDDALKASSSGGELGLQVCADDPQVAVHAVRNLARIAAGRAGARWSQAGFGRTSRTTAGQHTPRNLLGFKDGTNNILSDDPDGLDRDVWVARDDGPAWLAGGTYLVLRKIEVLIEDWDQEPLSSQQTIIGRAKGSGAPLSGGHELSAPDFEARVGGALAIDRASHVRLAHPSNNRGRRILRRGYNYVDGHHPDGRLDAGLVFISFQRTPGQFIAIQRALATDRLNEYVRHVGSAIFAVPPGASAGGYIGETLLG
jgi:deferrochelatase/peroxidase EfeB